MLFRAQCGRWAGENVGSGFEIGEEELDAGTHIVQKRAGFGEGVRGLSSMPRLRDGYEMWVARVVEVGGGLEHLLRGRERVGEESEGW